VPTAVPPASPTVTALPTAPAPTPTSSIIVQRETG
jgi:hypothetical protein